MNVIPLHEYSPASSRETALTVMHLTQIALADEARAEIHVSITAGQPLDAYAASSITYRSDGDLRSMAGY
jgi:hypothetical protein